MPFSAHHVRQHAVLIGVISGDVQLDSLIKVIAEGQALYLRDPKLVEMPLKAFLYQI